MTYESLDLLYTVTRPHDNRQQMAFVLAASRCSLFKKNEPRGILHKLEVTPVPNFANAQMTVTSEFLPALNACSQIITVNHKLKVACFDQGSVLPIKNFAYNKTPKFDSAAKMTHHHGQVNCLAADSSGTQLASGCTAGQITLYQVRDEEISFLSRTDETSPASFITGLAYIRPTPEFSFGPHDPDVYSGDNILLYTTHDGLICLLDTRCKLARPINTQIIITSQPRVNITTLTHMKSLPGDIVYFGGAYGELFACDLRKHGRYIFEHRSYDDGCIRRMKEIVIQDGPRSRTFLAHTTSSEKIKILDIETMKQDDCWKCERLPEGKVRDLVQVGNRIVTCGDQTSIGCWEWDIPDRISMS